MLLWHIKRFYGQLSHFEGGCIMNLSEAIWSNRYINQHVVGSHMILEQYWQQCFREGTITQSLSVVDHHVSPPPRPQMHERIEQTWDQPCLHQQCHNHLCLIRCLCIIRYILSVDMDWMLSRHIICRRLANSQLTSGHPLRQLPPTVQQR